MELIDIMSTTENATIDATLRVTIADIEAALERLVGILVRWICCWCAAVAVARFQDLRPLKRGAIA